MPCAKIHRRQVIFEEKPENPAKTLEILLCHPLVYE